MLITPIGYLLFGGKKNERNCSLDELGEYEFVFFDGGKNQIGTFQRKIIFNKLISNDLKTQFTDRYNMDYSKETEWIKKKFPMISIIYVNK